MSEELAARGVGERAVVGKLVDFSDVVEKCAAEEQVAVHLRIVLADQIAGAKQRDDVIEQASDVGVMQGLGGWGVAVSGGNFRVGHERLNQRLEVLVLEGRDEVCQCLPEFINILRRLRQVVIELNFGFAKLAQFVNRELKAVL